MNGSKVVVISYDITDDKRRRKLVKLAEGLGRRVQYSVFESLLKQGQIKSFVREAQTVIATSEGDSIRIYRVCDECYEHGIYLGCGAIKWPEAVI